MYYIKFFRSRAPGLPLEHPECSKIFTEQGQKLCATPDDIMNPSHCDKSTVNTSAWYRGHKLLRATPSTLIRHGWEGIGGKELWLWHPEVHELRHGGQRDCCPHPPPWPTSKKRHVCGKLIVGLARSGCNSAPRLNFLNILKYCIKVPLTPIFKHP